jgi:nucleoside 2-deoxyribosyltransferase
VPRIITLKEALATVKRVYLAAPSAEMDRAIFAASSLRDRGLTITEPWWARIIEAKRMGYGHDREVPEDFMRESSERNRRGIDSAEVVIALCRTSGGVSSGVAWEIGYACARQTVAHTVLVGNADGFVGAPLCSHRVADFTEVIEAIDSFHRSEHSEGELA